VSFQLSGPYTAARHKYAIITKPKAAIILVILDFILSRYLKVKIDKFIGCKFGTVLTEYNYRYQQKNKYRPPESHVLLKQELSDIELLLVPDD
jgi:hypothetical protein